MKSVLFNSLTEYTNVLVYADLFPQFLIFEKYFVDQY